MSNIQFEGEVNSVSEKQLGLISEAVVKNGFDGAKVTIKTLGQAGDNYSTSVKRIVAEKDGKVFRMVAKIGLTDSHMGDETLSHKTFCNEDLMYNQFLPKLRQLEESASIPETERYKFPVCYGSILEDKNDMILLEDLADFTMLDKFTSLTDDTVRMVLKSFARFHATSFVLKNKERETFNNIENGIHELWTSVLRAMKPIMTSCEADILMLMEEENVKYKTAIEGTLSKLDEMYSKLKDIDSRFSVIIHGDAWTNNIMFKLKEGTPVNVCLIDYQSPNFTNPVLDLAYFIFNCTDYETRKAHFADWIDFYHSELDQFFVLCGLKTNEVYSREQLDADLKRFSKDVLPMAIFVSVVCLRKPAEAEEIKTAMSQKDLKDSSDTWKISNLSANTKEVFLTRVKGIIDSYYDLGFLST